VTAINYLRPELIYAGSTIDILGLDSIVSHGDIRRKTIGCNLELEDILPSECVDGSVPHHT
jgi:hypothetical protein